jgi:FG-GAP-like repeat
MQIPIVGPARTVALTVSVLAASALIQGIEALGADPVPLRALHSFTKQQLSTEFWSEGANFGDFNHDGRKDVVSGPYWWEGPDFKKRHQYAAADVSFKKKASDGTEVSIPGYEGALGSNNAYSKNFFAYSTDLNGDGWDDILILGFPGEQSYWYENPKGGDAQWKKHIAIEVTDNESPGFFDLTGDGKPEIVCASHGFYGYATPDASDPGKLWAWHPISPNNGYQRFTHGMGYGDVNGDGRTDLLEKDGWWEQPESLVGDPVWRFHAYPFAPAGCSHMFAYDVNGDGLNDVVCGLVAHGYGLAWYEQYREDGEIKFRPHVFMNKEASENPFGIHFSQLHALDLVDMDGDGLKDIVTGKRFWAHGKDGDPEPNAAPVLYWWKLVRYSDRTAEFVPHLIDDASGIGTQVIAADYNGDGMPDIVVGNKRGTYLFTHEVKQVTSEEWESAQPRRLSK